jgi:replicative DNA helicase
MKRKANETTFMTAAECVRALLREPCIHVPTGLPTLDKITRGGPIAGDLMVIAGAPNAGKTSLVVQICLHAARSGCGVAIFCIDEARRSISYRIGQHNGFTLEDMEAQVPDAVESCAKRCDEKLPNLFITTQDDMSIEDAAAVLAHRCAGKTLVLAVDSLQTTRSSRAPRTRDIREQVNAATMTVKDIAKDTGALVIVTSTVGRASYGKGNKNADMAAFKESGDIEYAMSLGLVLRPDAPDSDIIHVVIPKNKRGQHTPFSLKRDPVTCSYEEIAPVRNVSRNGKIEFLCSRVLTYIKEQNAAGRGVAGKSEIAGELKVRESDVSEAVEMLLSQNAVQNRSTVKRPDYWIP